MIIKERPIILLSGLLAAEDSYEFSDLRLSAGESLILSHPSGNGFSFNRIIVKPVSVSVSVSVSELGILILMLTEIFFKKISAFDKVEEQGSPPRVEPRHLIFVLILGLPAVGWLCLVIFS
jgi:hypothetical protein